MILLKRSDKLTSEGKKPLYSVFPVLKNVKEDLLDAVRKDLENLNATQKLIVKSGSYSIETLNKEIVKQLKSVSVAIEKKI